MRYIHVLGKNTVIVNQIIYVFSRHVSLQHREAVVQTKYTCNAHLIIRLILGKKRRSLFEN